MVLVNEVESKHGMVAINIRPKSYAVVRTQHRGLTYQFARDANNKALLSTDLSLRDCVCSGAPIHVPIHCTVAVWNRRSRHCGDRHTGVCLSAVTSPTITEIGHHRRYARRRRVWPPATLSGTSSSSGSIRQTSCADAGSEVTDLQPYTAAVDCSAKTDPPCFLGSNVSAVQQV